MKCRVADYIISEIYGAGGKNVFMVTGGMIMHLTDAVYQNGKMKFTCCHHEQAATMAAEAYGRATNKLGVALVTAGPAALNTLNSVVGAWVDRSPCIIVSGQSKVSQASVTTPRQFSLQGFNTLPIFEQVTKFAVMLDDISKVRYEMEKAIYLATSHPVGPVWVECPIDIQATLFDPDDYEGFVPVKDTSSVTEVMSKLDQVATVIKNAKRPCILAGAGLRLSGAINSFHEMINKHNIPVVTSRLGMDLIGYDNPLFIGRPGTYGDRPANFAVQNCDVLITIGCRMGIGLVGYDYAAFAPKATKIVVDVDEKELTKPSVIPDIPVKADAKDFIEILSKELGDFRFSNEEWIMKARGWKSKYPVNLPEYKEEKEGINSYHFITNLSEKASADDTFLLDTGSCFHVHGQAFKVKYGQRHIVTGGLSTMGYMPGVLGPAVLSGERGVYCITGDGSLQMNIQELQTIMTNNLPVKLVVLNNNGYLLIKLTQQNFCEGRLIGESPDTGVGFPSLQKLSAAYGLGYMKITSINHLDEKLDDLIAARGPLICEVITPSQQLLIPRVASKQLEDGSMMSMPYDDMFPYLDREEYQANQCD